MLGLRHAPQHAVQLARGFLDLDPDGVAIGSSNLVAVRRRPFTVENQADRLNVPGQGQVDQLTNEQLAACLVAAGRDFFELLPGNRRESARTP